MQMSITAKTAMGTAATFVLMLLIGLSSYQQWRDQLEATHWVAHSYQIMTELGMLRSATQWAESATLSFVLTGNPIYADQFERAKPEVALRLTNVRNLTQDNQSQQVRVGKLTSLLQRNFKICGETIETRKQKGSSAAAAVCESGGSHVLIGEIRSLVNEMKAEEGRLLALRNARLESASRAALGLVAMLIAAGAALLIIMMYLVRHYSLQQAQSQASLRAAFNEIEQGQSALAKSEASLSAIVNSLGEGLFQLDAQGNIVYMNPAGERILGYASASVMNTPLHDLIHSSLQEQKKRPSAECGLLKNLSATSASAGADDEFLRFDGTPVPVRYVTAPLMSGGKMSGTVVSFEDITQRKEAERRVTEFYSTVSHELRTPLTSIRAALGLMQGGMAGELSAKATQLVNIAKSECDRLIRLINDILDLRKIEAGKLELLRTSNTAAELVATTRDAVASLAAENDVTIEADVKTTGPIKCDKDRIVQVLTNLVGNAIKFSPRGSKVIIAVEPVAGIGEKFSVCDQGPGIPPDKRHQLFGRFQQLDSSDSRPKGGTGLGLAISKAIVEQHGGSIDVDSELGKGSTFWFMLPSYASTVDLERLPQISVAHNTVLVVEDDEHIAVMIREMLAHEDYEVIWAPSIKAAEEQIEQKLPQAILLDIQLPDGNGLELMARLRQSTRTQTVPIIILTGRESEWKTYGEPFLVDWITKPLDERRLFLALKVAMLQQRAESANVLIVEDDLPTRKLLVEQLSQLGVQCFEAADGAEALELSRRYQFDLLVLDVGIPPPDGFELIDTLRHESSRSTPLLVYTSRDLTSADMNSLTLGLTRHLVKSRTSESEFLSTVRFLLKGVLRSPRDSAQSDTKAKLTEIEK